MLNPRSFSDILEAFEEGTTAEPTYATSYAAGWESVLDAHGLAQILAQTEQFHVRQTAAPGGYAGLRKARSHHASFGTQTAFNASPARPAHIFNPEQQVAYNTLSRWSPGLPAGFNARQLKSAYRIAMLKTHPDQGGSSESFQEAKKCYQILSAFVKNEA